MINVRIRATETIIAITTIGWLLCQRLHAAVLIGVSLAHGQVSTISFNLLRYFVYVLHEFGTLYIFNVAGHWAQ